MRTLKRIQLTGLLILLLTAVTVTSCGMRQTAAGNPIEPVVPGENGESQTLQGRFAAKSNSVKILDLSVTADGSLTAMGTDSRTLYLLEQGGNLLWEKLLSSEAQQIFLDPSGRYLAVGTADGKLLLLRPDQPQNVEEHVLPAPVATLSVSDDGELILVGLTPPESGQANRLLLLDRRGTIVWQEEFETIVSARIAGRDNRIFVHWLTGDEPSIASYTVQGELLWELGKRGQMALDAAGRVLVSARGKDILRYDDTGEELSAYAVAGAVNRLIMAESGAYFSALITDEATQNQELLYFDADGRKLWSKRLPNDSDVLLSDDGERVIVASWRQYRDDATQVFVYNQRGQELNVLEVAGRAQRMALANRAGTLALGLEDGSVYFLNISEPASKPMNATTDNSGREAEKYYTPVSFERVDGESPLVLYFYDDSAEHLIPVTRRVKRTQSVLRASIEELVRGPVQGSNLNRTIPKDAEIQVSHSEGQVNIDLPPSLHEMGGTTFLTGVLDSLLLTVSQFPTVEQIEFTVGGEKSPTFGQEGLTIEEAFVPQRYGRKPGERLLFLPSVSGNRYYLRTKSASFLPLKDQPLIESMVRQIIKQSEDLYPVTLNEVRIENNTVYLDFSESFNRILAGNPEAAARAAMLRDALALTVTENVHYSHIQITVNGSIPMRPLHYQPWELIVSRPFYINQED